MCSLCLGGCNWFAGCRITSSDIKAEVGPSLIINSVLPAEKQLRYNNSTYAKIDSAYFPEQSPRIMLHINSDERVNQFKLIERNKGKEQKKNYIQFLSLLSISSALCIFYRIFVEICLDLLEISIRSVRNFILSCNVPMSAKPTTFRYMCVFICKKFLDGLISQTQS